MLWLVTTLLLAGTEPALGPKAPSAVRFRCEASAPKLAVVVDDVELTLDVAGVRFSEKPLLLEDSRLAVDATVAGERGSVLAAKKPEPGLYRVSKAGGEPTLLVAAEVWTLCMTGDGDAWAIVSRDGMVRFVLVSSGSPVVRFFDLGETLLQALQASPQVSAAQARRAFSLLASLGWPEAGRFGDVLLQHERSDLRAVMAQVLALRDDATSRAGLWLLAHDKVLAVREEAFRAVRQRCYGKPEAACADLFAMFIDDASQEQAWMARDYLLVAKPEVALKNASTAYKLDAITLLTKERERLGLEAVRNAAELLATDQDVSVRRAARGLLEQFE